MIARTKSPGRLSTIREGAFPALAGCAAGIAFLFAYRNAATALVQHWLSDNAYTHGFLIPGISLYLVWARRKDLQKACVRPAGTLGAALLVAALAMLLLGQAANIVIAQELSLPIMLAGIITFSLGLQFLKILWVPVVYLFFMTPLWNNLTGPVIPHYQRISAIMGSLLMQTAGVPVYRQGQFIDLPNIRLEVAEACSGVRYLEAVAATAIPLAYLFIKSRLRKGALVFMGLGIATLFNGLRIGLIGIFSYYGISDVLHGPGHILHGLSVSLAGFGALFGAVLLLSEKKPTKSIITASVGRASRQVFSGRKENPARRLWQIAAVLAFAAFYFQIQTIAPVPLKKSLHLFPARIGEWVITLKQSTFESGNYIQPDHSLSRTYTTAGQSSVSLFIGYFEQQKLHKKLVNKKIAGLERDADVRTLDLGAGETKKIKALVTTVNGDAELVLFWYHISGRIIADSRWALLSTAVNAVTLGRQNGALIVISQKIADGANEDRAIKNCAAFAKDVIRLVDQFLP